MVSPKPNSTRLTGTVRELRQHPRWAERLELVIDVERADDIDGKANLLADASGGELSITTDFDDVADLDLKPGDPVVVGAELRGPGAVWSRPRMVRRGP